MDDARRRLVYAVVGSEHLTHHNASVEVLADGAGAKVIWTADFLPDAAAGPLDEIMGIGAEAMRKALGLA